MSLLFDTLFYFQEKEKWRIHKLSSFIAILHLWMPISILARQESMNFCQFLTAGEPFYYYYFEVLDSIYRHYKYFSIGKVTLKKSKQQKFLFL